MNESSAPLPGNEDEFLRAGLTPVRGQQVKAPLVGESPVNFECLLTQCIQLQNHQGGSLTSWLVLGEVVMIHIDENLLENGIYQTSKAQPILRAGGPTSYYGISESERFELARPNGRSG